MPICSVEMALLARELLERTTIQINKIAGWRSSMVDIGCVSDEAADFTVKATSITLTIGHGNNMVTIV